ncbi:MAG: DUF1624 domain-containing protein [Sphingosinicella sp.]|nr:DUF1624 domain-containing protein [Sphingosinicella sp.]
MTGSTETLTPADDPIEARPVATTRAGVRRLDTIDMLRGLVITLMVLDHVRDFFHYDALRFDPTDPTKTTLVIFGTRWITHLCATTFVFLAGVSIFLQKTNGKPPAELSRFLIQRGLWLILLEATVVSFAFNFAEPILFFQVIWAIGASMICMAFLSRSSTQAVLIVGILLLALCPTLIAASQGAEGAASIVRTLMLAPGIFPSVPMIAVYPLLPWLAVMCLGYGLGPIFAAEAEDRRKRLLGIAIGMIAIFLILRSLNLGDPAPWVHFANPAQTAMSFLNLSKYPPSPDFVMATLGVSLLIFLALEHLRGPIASCLLTFGRTPLFTYLCHIYIAHGLMLLIALASGFPAAVATDFLLSGKVVSLGWGFSLPVAYLVWLLVLALMYPLSAWFEGVKRRRSDPWLSFL